MRKDLEWLDSTSQGVSNDEIEKCEKFLDVKFPANLRELMKFGKDAMPYLQGDLCNLVKLKPPSPIGAGVSNTVSFYGCLTPQLVMEMFQIQLDDLEDRYNITAIKIVPVCGLASGNLCLNYDVIGKNHSPEVWAYDRDLEEDEADIGFFYVAKSFSEFIEMLEIHE